MTGRLSSVFWAFFVLLSFTFLSCQSHTCASIRLTRSVVSYAFISAKPNYDFLRPNLRRSTLAILRRPRGSGRAANFWNLFCLMLKICIVIGWESQINTYCVLAALHCVQQNQGCVLGGAGWGGRLSWMCSVSECESEMCGLWPCSTQTQQLRLRLAEKIQQKNVKHTYTYCNVCLDLSLTLFLNPFPTFYFNHGAERHCFTSLSLLTTAAYLLQ